MEGKKWEYYTANPYVYVHIKDARKDLIKNPTCAEHILWDYLRNRKTGYKIRRQHVIDKYVVDFVCLSKKLVIEIDGGIHNQQKEQDELRTQDLNCIGYTVIRFTNDEVYENAGVVAQRIKEELDKIKSMESHKDLPSPSKEGNFG
jgi:very-short-patch-repair endonuclease